jgi:hypothetical protein
VSHYHFSIKMISKLFSIFIVFCAIIGTSAHTTQVCTVVSGSTVTIYAGSYHSGTVPVGGVLLNGVRYDFTSAVTAGSFTPPTDSACTVKCGGSAHQRWQTVIVSGLADGTYTVDTTCDTAIECPLRSDCFNDIVIEGIEPENPCKPDTTDPNISCPVSPITINVNRECRAELPRLHALGCDACSDVTIIQTPSGGTVVGTGSYTVTMTGVDASGNQDTCSVIVNVVDTISPIVTSCTASPTILWPPNHSMRPVTVSVSAIDNCGKIHCYIRDVWTNDDDAGDIVNNPDINITGLLTVDLRAERDPAETPGGRVYTIVVDCIDSSKNISTHTIDVTVPVNNGGHSSSRGRIDKSSPDF